MLPPVRNGPATARAPALSLILGVVVIVVAMGGCISKETSDPDPTNATSEGAATGTEPGDIAPTNGTLAPADLDQVPMRISAVAGAGSATLHSDMPLNHTLTLAASTGTERVFNWTGSTLQLDFLEPATTYQWAIEGINTRGEFTTTELNWTWAGTDAVIRPGLPTETTCPISALLRNADYTEVYAWLIGHCTPEVGTELTVWHDIDGRIPIGKVVDVQDVGWQDWALVRLRSEALDYATPSIAHWTGPTAVTQAPGPAVGEKVCYTGAGNAFSLTQHTRHRCGQLLDYETHAEENLTVSVFNFRGAVDAGDSGSPVIDYATGTLIGTIRGDGSSLGTNEGITTCTVMAQLRAANWDLAVIPAPYDPPAADPFVEVDPSSEATLQCAPTAS